MKKVTYFREKPLINRKQEISFIKDYFTKLPERILWIYGPKSTGKTTLIEYIVENELFDDFKLFKSSKYNVKYINFRRKVIGNYDMFLNSLIKPINEEVGAELSLQFNLGVFRLSPKLYAKSQNKEEDIFDILLEQFRQSKKRNVLIIDEIQVLQDIYINGGKILLNEFLNFCVSLTKETHLSHVVILSSNTIFINEIYENAKLKETSEFYKIDHLEYDEVKKWLKGGYDNPHKFNDEEINLIWDYLGGTISRIQKLLTNFCELKMFDTLEEYLENEAKLALSDFNMCFRELVMKDKEELIEYFKKVSKEILKNGYSFYDGTDKKMFEMIDYFCQKEILFFEPSDTKVYPNSKIFVKGMEKLVLSVK
jgi:AAA+ ATPase superfamily predicted ATPase